MITLATLCVSVSPIRTLFEILASTYGPGPYALGPYGSGPLIILKN